MMTCCEKCGGTRFIAHQLVRMDVIVDAEWNFIANVSDKAESDIYDAEEPYGPYTCAECGMEYENLPSTYERILHQDLHVGAEDLAQIEKLLNEEPESEEECMGEDETISYTANFGNGIEMDVKVCGVQYEEGGNNTPWTEAVLFENGCEVGCSDACDVFEGEWELEHEGIMYTVNVMA